MKRNTTPITIRFELVLFSQRFFCFLRMGFFNENRNFLLNELSFLTSSSFLFLKSLEICC